MSLGIFGDDILSRAVELFREVGQQPEDVRIQLVNALRRELAKHSPFSAEPVDCVEWVPSEMVTANDYNPNSVAPPEMRLLEVSIIQDGYTQPIVAWRRDGDNGAAVYEVVDGFHRNRVGRESAAVRGRVRGHLPLTIINDARSDKGDRIAATIRHNRARGKHQVEAMSDIVTELKRRNWSDDKIGRELGMDPDEVLRLTQITGLAELFANQEFSTAWEVENTSDQSGGEILSDAIVEEVTPKSGRILHTWDKWECYRAGFYAEMPPGGVTQSEGEELYRDFLADAERFDAALAVVTTQWTHSCEHYLTNERMNRIAWLGQAAAAQAIGMPSCCRGGYHLLSDAQKAAADSLALRYLNAWLSERGMPTLDPSAAASKTMMDLY